MSMSKCIMNTLHLLSVEQKYLTVLAYLYQLKSNPLPIRHEKLCGKFQLGKANSTYHIKALVDHELVQKEKSKITGKIVGYKISGKGIQFFELYKKLAVVVEAE